MKRTLIISLSLLALVGACSFFTSGYETDESIRNEIPKGYLGNLKTTPTPVPTSTPISEESLKQKVLDLEEELIKLKENELIKLKENTNCDFAKYIIQREWSDGEYQMSQRNYEIWVKDAEKLSALINENDFWYYPFDKIGEPYSPNKSIEEFAGQNNLIVHHFKIFGRAAGSVRPFPGSSFSYLSNRTKCEGGNCLVSPDPLIENNCP